MAKLKARQIEVRFDKPEPFKLVVQTTTDGDRVVREKEQLEADRKASEEKQKRLI